MLSVSVLALLRKSPHLSWRAGARAVLLRHEMYRMVLCQFGEENPKKAKVKVGL